MIFSLTKSSLQHELIELPNTDLFCYFPVKNSIYLPASALKLALLASLKQKKEILLLRGPGLPSLISRNQQWDSSDHWLWLPPRSASVISKSWSNSELELDSFDQLISKLKLLK